MSKYKCKQFVLTWMREVAQLEPIKGFLRMLLVTVSNRSWELSYGSNPTHVSYHHFLGRDTRIK